MESIVQDDSMPIAYLLDFWDDLDEGERKRLYFYAKINDRLLQQGFVLLVILLFTIVIILGKGAVAPVIRMFPFLAAH